MDQMKIAMVTDSAASLTEEDCKQHNIFVVPLRVIYKDGEYRDNVEITADEVYSRIESEVPSTSLPLPEDVSTLYTRLADEGYTHVIHVCISSGLSGTYNMVRMVAQDFPRLNVEVIDSRILANAQGAMVLEGAQKLAETGSIPQAIEHMNAIRKTATGMFVIRTLEYLRKGGRIGLVENVIGTMLNIKPIIFVNDDGVYQTLTKARGFSAAIESMLEQAKQRYQQRPVRIAVAYGDALEDARDLLQQAKEALHSVGEGLLSQVSPVLGVHTGPSLLGLIIYEV